MADQRPLTADPSQAIETQPGRRARGSSRAHDTRTAVASVCDKALKIVVVDRLAIRREFEGRGIVGDQLAAARDPAPFLAGSA